MYILNMSSVQRQLFILSLLLHNSVDPVSSCLLVLPPPSTLRWRAPLPLGFLADGHPCRRAPLPSGFLPSCFLAYGLPCIWASSPTSTPRQRVLPSHFFCPFITFSSQFRFQRLILTRLINVSMSLLLLQQWVALPWITSLASTFEWTSTLILSIYSRQSSSWAAKSLATSQHILVLIAYVRAVQWLYT